MALILGVVGFFLYSPSLKFPFVHDDIVFIVQNPQIARWDNLAEVFTAASQSHHDTSIINSYYRPLLEVYYRLGYFLFGLNAGGFHFVNIILHIFNAILIVRFLPRIGMGQTESFLAGLLFLIHPVQTQAVVCISGISNLLMAFFCLSALQCGLSFKGSQSRIRRWIFFAAFLFSYVAALLSKEQAIILPLLVLTLGCFGRREIQAQAKTNKILTPILATSFIVSAVFLFWRSMIAGSQTTGILDYPHELKLRLLAVPQALLTYLKILFWPVDLHYYRALNILSPWAIYAIVLAALLSAVFIFIKNLPREERRHFYLGIAWFLAALLPVLNIVPLIIEYSYISLAEHFLYFSSVGIFIVLLTVARSLLARYFNERYELIAMSLTVFVFFWFCAVTLEQQSFWRGEIPLFQRALQFEPQLGRVHVLLGKAYFFEKRFDEAVVELSRAQRLFENYYSKAGDSPAKDFYRGFLKGVCFDLANVYSAAGNFPLALVNYQKAGELDPRDSVILNNMAGLYMQTGQWDKAAAILKQALGRDPRNVLVINSLGVCAIQRGERKEAEHWFTQALKQDPQFVPARDNLKKVLTETSP